VLYSTVIDTIQQVINGTAIDTIQQVHGTAIDPLKQVIYIL